jgi:hypothetical protein
MSRGEKFMQKNVHKSWMTVWRQTAEEEWIDEPYAAGENRHGCQSRDLQFQPEAAAVLGKMSCPTNAWAQITMLVLIAIEEHWREAEQLGREWRVGQLWSDPTDLQQLHIRATELDPVFAINEFNYVNPDIMLDRPNLLNTIPPLDALRAVIRMWTDNDHRSDAL